MNEYNRVNTIDETETSPSAHLHDDDHHLIFPPSSMAPQWPISPPTTLGVMSNNKFDDTSPTSPGTYYATINSTVSRRYLLACNHSVVITINLYFILRCVLSNFCFCIHFIFQKVKNSFKNNNDTIAVHEMFFDIFFNFRQIHKYESFVEVTLNNI